MKSSIFLVQVILNLKWSSKIFENSFLKNGILDFWFETLISTAWGFRFYQTIKFPYHDGHWKLNPNLKYYTQLLRQMWSSAFLGYSAVLKSPIKLIVKFKYNLFINLNKLPAGYVFRENLLLLENGKFHFRLIPWWCFASLRQ